MTLLKSVRSHGIHDIKTIIDSLNGDVSRETLKNYWLYKPTLFAMICYAVKNKAT
jgi:hypothetical protein